MARILLKLSKNKLKSCYTKVGLRDKDPRDPTCWSRIFGTGTDSLGRPRTRDRSGPTRVRDRDPMVLGLRIEKAGTRAGYFLQRDERFYTQDQKFSGKVSRSRADVYSYIPKRTRQINENNPQLEGVKQKLGKKLHKLWPIPRLRTS